MKRYPLRKRSGIKLPFLRLRMLQGVWDLRKEVGGRTIEQTPRGWEMGERLVLQQLLLLTSKQPRHPESVWPPR